MTRPASARVVTQEVEQTAIRPWWAKGPFLGRTAPALTAHQWRLLGVVGIATLFDNYGMGILGLALPQIQHGLGVAEADVGALTAVVRLGVIPAVLLSAWADHVGRRLLLLVTIVGGTVCTFASAFALNAAQFMALQFLSRIFIDGEAMLAIVVVAEDFDADTRGWGIGMLSALGALGHGLVAIIFSSVNVLPFGWRALFVLGIIPLALLPWYRRSLMETRRFASHRESREQRHVVRAILQPFRNLARMYPGRMVALCAALFPIAFVLEPAIMFVSKSLQQIHGYSPGTVAALFLTVGVVAPIGNVMAGALGDRFGRKRVIMAGIVSNTAAIALFYNTTGPWIPPMFGFMLLTLTIVLVLFAALGSELFPTSYRSTASGVRAVIATLGGTLGLWLEGRLYVLTGSHSGALTSMLVVTPIALVIIALFLPETANQELEEIAPERA